MKRWCSACGGEATMIVYVEVNRQRLEGGKQYRTVVPLLLCEACSGRASRTLRRDVEQAERVARALTDEGRQLRKDEAWARRKALREELANQ
jgi:hypothetical protein